MSDEINPRQFISLDYNDADLYGGLSQRPAPAIPLEKAIAPTQTGRENASTRAMEKNLWELETARNAQFLREQKEQAIAREEEIIRREQARRQEIANKISNNQPKSEEVSQPPKSESPLTKQQRSTPERQPQPSTGSPPPTPSGTAARANPLVEPTATPAPAALPEPMPSPAPKAGSGLSFSSLPTGVGRAIVPGVFTAANFADRVVHGQPVVQAASGAGASLVGGIAGGIAGTAVAGPIGGLVGGYVGGAISDWFFQPPNTGSPPVEVPNYPPFRGGQVPRVQYLVKGEFDVFQALTQNRIPAFVRHSSVQGVIFGPINSIKFKDGKDGDFIGFLIDGYNQFGDPEIAFPQVGHAGGEYGANPSKITILRVDGKNEIYPDKTAPAPPPDNDPYHFNVSPIGNNNSTPSGTPGARKKIGNNKDVAPSMPSGNTPNGNSFFPGHGGLAPSKNPNPTQAPSNLGGGLPATKQPPPPPLPFAEPDDIPAPRTITFNTPGGGTVTSSQGGGLALGPPSFPGSTVKYDSQGNVLPTGIDGKDPYSFKPNPLVANPLVANGLQPNGLPSTKAPSPISDADSPIPKSNTSPKPETTGQAETHKQSDNNEATKKAIQEEVKKLTEIGALIAGLTPIIKGIPDAIAKSPTVQAANKKTTKDAVCEIAQPGGCLGNALDDSADKINQNNDKNANNILDKINAGANAAQLALLELINTKLGNLIPGGLSGKLERLSKWLHLNRALNILIWWQTLHNAYMLSANLGQTLTSAISNVLAAIGIKDAEGSPLNIGEILGHEFDSLAKSVIGESEWGSIKAEYKKWNRIYQAAANLLNAVQSIGYSIISALEVVGSYVALIGNALRKWGEVGESAYRWFNPQPNFHDKFFTVLENTTNVVSQVDQVASEVLSVQDNVNQIGQLKNELNKSLSEESESKQGTIPPEAAKIKDTAEKSKSASATGLQLQDTDFEPDDGD
ncbi:MAG: hypothetical protein V7K35_26655 [Nostoc sp.]|uniref:hypothetical protein n=1 Tax=Nostoc sp. TaxID=1180 RepID=UPI002FF792DB